MVLLEGFSDPVLPDGVLALGPEPVLAGVPPGQANRLLTEQADVARPVHSLEQIPAACRDRLGLVVADRGGILANRLVPERLDDFLADRRGRCHRVVVVAAEVVADLAGDVDADLRHVALTPGGQRLQEPLPDRLVLIDGEVVPDGEVAEVDQHAGRLGLQEVSQTSCLSERPLLTAGERTTWVSTSWTP